MNTVHAGAGLPVTEDNNTVHKPIDGLAQPERGWAMLVIILGLIVAVLDGTIVNLALPGIARELQASPSQAIWVVNAYQIATLVMLLPLASLGDLVGYRRVYLVGMAVFTLSSLAATFANSLGTLIAARALPGAGRGRHHERERGAGAADVSVGAAGQGHGHQLAGGGHIVGGRAFGGGGHFVGGYRGPGSSPSTCRWALSPSRWA